MTENEKLMFTKFYNPNMKYTSIKKLYDEVKSSGISLVEVRNFILNQETSQVFKKHKRIKHYFPIVAKHKFEIVQIYLCDMSDIAAANENYKYLLVCVDVFSRLAFFIPMKNKKTPAIIESIEELIDTIEPPMTNCDNGS